LPCRYFGLGTEGTISDVSLTGNDLLGSGSGIDVNGPTIASVSAIGNYWGDHLVPPGKDPVVDARTGGHRLRQLVHNRHVSVVALLTTFAVGDCGLVARLRDRHVVRAGNRRGRALTGFVVTPFDSNTGQAGSSIRSDPTATSAALTGLTGGDSYTFAVAASNGVATGTVDEFQLSRGRASVVPRCAPRREFQLGSGTPVSGVAANSVTTTVS